MKNKNKLSHLKKPLLNHLLSYFDMRRAREDLVTFANPFKIINPKHMFRAISKGFALVVIILVLQAFFPGIVSGLVQAVIKVISLMNYQLDQMPGTSQY